VPPDARAEPDPEVTAREEAARRRAARDAEEREVDRILAKFARQGRESLTDAVSGEHGGAICSIATTLREWNLTKDHDGVETDHLRQVWDDLWPAEHRLIEVVAETRRRWQEAAGSPAEFTELHRHLATQALDAMRKELADMKKAALTLPAPPPPRFPSPDPAPTLAP
jgi:hypothetical protein